MNGTIRNAVSIVILIEDIDSWTRTITICALVSASTHPVLSVVAAQVEAIMCTYRAPIGATAVELEAFAVIRHHRTVIVGAETNWTSNGGFQRRRCHVVSLIFLII
jgi:hypothetical protein